MTVNPDLTTIWAFIIAFSVFMYVVMDGLNSLSLPRPGRGTQPGDERHRTSLGWQ
jgi:hypothetical protein